MIRINLVQRKQASYLSGSKTNAGAGAGLRSLGAGGLSSAAPLLKSIGIPIALCIAANFAYDYYIDQKTAEMNQEVALIEKQKAAINKELDKIKGFESVKVEIERNELVLRAKIDTIERLIRGRDFTAKSLITLAQAMPRDIWMTDLKGTETGFEFKGGAVDVGLVTDFMSKLGQTIYFKDVALKNTASDPSGQTATFELTARRD